MVSWSVSLNREPCKIADQIEMPAVQGVNLFLGLRELYQIIIVIMVASRRCTTMSTVDSTPPELSSRTKGGIVS